MPKRERAREGNEHSKEQHVAKKARQDELDGNQQAFTINSDRDLQLLLAFRQDAKELKASIKKFRAFLHTIIYPAEGQTANRTNLEHLTNYLARNKSTEEDDESPAYIKDLIETWTFASAKNDDSLFSASVAVIALLLKTISTEIDLRDHGLGICRTLLQQNSAKLILKGVSAPRHKEHIISPCFRLLTEIVSFDGGTMGRQLYNKRDQTFDARIIARNLGLGGRTKDDHDTDARPSVRSNVVRYLLANLKFQVEGIKIDIIKQSNVISALLQGLVDDPVPLIADVLATINKNILQDRSIPWTSKIHLLGDRSLKSFATLYRLERPEEVVTGTNRTILQTVHEFMLLICTTSVGSLRHSSGFYPTMASVPDGQVQEREFEDIEYEEDVFSEHSQIIRNLSVRNQSLAQFAQSLRPYANELEKELLLAIFVAAPELVADYWMKKEAFNYDPKLTATWIGYSAFIFSVIRLPVPAFFGAPKGYALYPPSAAIVLESVLPLPLNQKSLKKCFSAQSSLINLFATRVLILAIEKLRSVVRTYREVDTESPNKSWAQASHTLLSLFMRRCPGMKDLIDLFRRIPETDVIQREAITRLLSLYYEVLPELALVEKFDISIVLTEALGLANHVQNLGSDDNLSLLILGNLVGIASHSTEVSWWKRPDKLKYSAFLTTLMVQVRSTSGAGDNLERLLISVVNEKGFFQTTTMQSAVRALVDSLREAGANGEPIGLLGFIDDCLSRFVTRQIAYEDQRDAFLNDHQMTMKETCPVSTWTMTLLEQWPFVEKNRISEVEAIAAWLSSFLQHLRICGEDQEFLLAIAMDMCNTTSNKIAKDILSDTITNLSSPKNKISVDTKLTHGLDNGSSLLDDADANIGLSSLDIFNPPEPPTISNFSRYKTVDVDALLNSSAIIDLILSMSSTDAPTRIQAASALQHFMIRLQAGSDPDRDMMYAVLGELVETAMQHQHDSATPLPYIITAFAVEALKVVRDPVHVMYIKVATFLTMRPQWSPFKLVREFLNLVIMAEPSEESDQAPWKECIWLLNWINNGVRTSMDCDVLRQVGAWETIGSLVAHPAFASSIVLESDIATSSMSGKSQKLICTAIVRLLGRAIALGEASTLVTRAGGLAWLRSWERSKHIDHKLAVSLQNALLTQGQDRTEKWSLGMLQNGKNRMLNGGS